MISSSDTYFWRLTRILVCVALLPSFPAEASPRLRILAGSELVRFGEKSAESAFHPADPAHEIRLFAAGNETVFIQIAVSGDLISGDTISLILPDLRPKNLSHQESTINDLQAFAVEDCQNGQFEPDCLVPLANTTTRVTDRDRQLGYKTIWLDIRTPPAHPTGLYQGTVTIQAADSTARLPLSLFVLPFSLPAQPSLRTDLNNYGVGFVRALGLDPVSDDGIAVVHGFHRLARDHGMTFNPLPYRSQLGTPHETMAPTVVGEGENLHVSDWTEYDRHYGPLFDGTAFADGQPVEHQFLPFNPDWPAPFTDYRDARPRYEAAWRALGREFVRHFSEKGWTKTHFQIYMNQKPRPHNTIPWNLDEPKGRSDYKALRYYAELTRQAFAEADPGRFRFRLDISHFYCDKHRWEFAKDFRINNGAAILTPVDDWVISAHSLDGETAREKAIRLLSQGKTIYEYYPDDRMPLLTEPLATGRYYAWRAWQEGVTGILFWNTVTKRDKISNGKDFLIYPGITNIFRGPLGSLRLKAVQRGIQDYEYLILAAKHNEINAVPEINAQSPASTYDTARRTLAAAIHGAILRNGPN